VVLPARQFPGQLGGRPAPAALVQRHHEVAGLDAVKDALSFLGLRDGGIATRGAQGERDVDEFGLQVRRQAGQVQADRVPDPVFRAGTDHQEP